MVGGERRQEENGEKIRDEREREWREHKSARARVCVWGGGGGVTQQDKRGGGEKTRGEW